MSLAPEFSNEFESYKPRTRYDLGDHEMNVLCHKLLAEREPYTNDAVVCYVLDHDSEYANIARSVERKVFEKYFGNDSDEMAAEYGQYENQSIFFLSVDRTTGEPVGVMRSIENGPQGFKTLNDLKQMHEAEPETFPAVDEQTLFEAHGIDDYDKCWDMGTAAVLDKYRSNKLLSVQMYRATYLAARERGIDHYISIIDKRPLDNMVKFLGIPFVPINNSEPFPYLGSPASYAIYGDVREFVPSILKKRWTKNGILARKVLKPLALGTKDDAIHL